MLKNRSFWMALWMVALSAVYSIAMFRGLENHSAYFGNAYKVLNPESFPQDPFVQSDRLTLQSLYYGIVKGVGPLWLDDRFTFFVFLAMAILSLIALDKTARLFGADRWGERLAILGLVLLEHMFFVTHVILVDNYGFNATALCGLLNVWILYGALAGWRPWLILSLMAMALGLSLRNAPSVVFIGLVLLARDWLSMRGRVVALAGTLFVLTLSLGAYYRFIRPADGSDVALYDFSVRYIEDTEANPFTLPLLPNLVFAGFCIAGLGLKGLPAPVLGKVKIIAAIGLVSWLLGGLYHTYTPDALKNPYLLIQALRRTLRWPSYILFVAIAVAVLKWLQKATTRKGILLSFMILMGLYLFHSEWRAELALLVGGVTLGMLWLFGRFRIESLSPSQRVWVAAVVMSIGTFSLYAVGGIRHRFPALVHLVRYGMMGDNPSAKWVGVNEYIRDHTPREAMVLALSREKDPSGQKWPLAFDGSLRVRTGRSMPMGHSVSFPFDLEKLKWWLMRREWVGELAQRWQAHDLAGVSLCLSALGWPDYLVVPDDEVDWLGALDFDYQTDARIHPFTILRRGHPVVARHAPHEG